jgi:hypothetical protein
VTGTLTTGSTILTLTVDDIYKTYRATIVEVAASNYQLRSPPLTGYALTVVR